MMRDIRTIKGLSDRRRLPRLGKIRLGIRQIKPGGGEYPAEVDYFVCPPEVRRVYGDRPTALRIMIPVEDTTQVFPQAYKWYGSSSGLKCKGDSQVAIRRWADVEPALQATLSGPHEANDLVEIPCPCSRLKSRECGVRAHLMVLLPEVSLSGVYQIDTGSISNVIEMNSSLDFLRSLLGRIAMIPLTLKREPVEMTHDGKKRVHHLLKLTFDGDLDAVGRIRDASRHDLLPALALPAPADDRIDVHAQLQEAEPVDMEQVVDVAGSTDRNGETQATARSEPPSQPATPEIATMSSAEKDTKPTRASAPPEGDRRSPEWDQRSQHAAPVSIGPTPTQTAIPAPPAASTQSPVNGRTCACGKQVSDSVVAYCRRYFAEIVCMDCQKTRFAVKRP